MNAIIRTPAILDHQSDVLVPTDTDCMATSVLSILGVFNKPCFLVNYIPVCCYHEATYEDAMFMKGELNILNIV